MPQNQRRAEHSKLAPLPNQSRHRFTTTHLAVRTFGEAHEGRSQLNMIVVADHIAEL